MMDPITIGLVIGLFVLIFAIAFLFVSGTQDNFDKWYSAQRKMDEEEGKRKKKAANSGKKPTKKEKNDTREKEEKKPVVVKNGEAKAIEVKEKAQPKTGKRNSKEEVAPLKEVSNIQSKQQEPVKHVETQKVEVQTVNNSLQSKSEDVKSKPKSAEREQSEPEKKKTVESDFTEVINKKKRNSESTEVKKANVAHVTSESKKLHRTLEEMDLGKLLTDMASGLTDNVHVQFFRSYLETQKKKENALSAASVASAVEKEDLYKQITDKTAELARIKNSTSQMHGERVGLLNALSKLQESESRLRQDLNQKSHEVTQLKSVEHTRNQALHMARQQVDENARKFEETARDLLYFRNKAKELEKRISETKKFEATTKEIHESWQKIKPSLTEKPTTPQESLEFQHVLKEKIVLEQQYVEDMNTWEERHQSLMDEYLAIQKLCDQLKDEVATFEKWKGELEKKEEKFDSEMKEIQKIRAKLDEEHAKLAKNIEELNKSAVPKSKLNGDSGEEVVTLAKAVDLTSAPSGNLEDKKLREENSRLKEKNEELRARNFKLAEMIEKAAPAVDSNKSVETKNDTKKNKKTKEATNNATTQSAPSEDAAKVKSYRDALFNVRLQLDNVSRLADKQTKRIHELEEQSKKRTLKAAAVCTFTPAHQSADHKPASDAGSQKGADEDWELV